MTAQVALILHLFQFSGDYTPSCLQMGPSVPIQVFLDPSFNKDMTCLLVTTPPCLFPMEISLPVFSCYLLPFLGAGSQEGASGSNILLLPVFFPGYFIPTLVLDPVSGLSCLMKKISLRTTTCLTPGHGPPWSH